MYKKAKWLSTWMFTLVFFKLYTQKHLRILPSNLKSLKIRVQKKYEEENFNYLKPQYQDKTNVNILEYFFAVFFLRMYFYLYKIGIL